MDGVTVLADTSVWIEFDHGTGSPTALRLRELLAARPLIAAGYTEPVLMEVLAGARTPRRAGELRALLRTARLLPLDAAADFESAALIYRRCRAVGVTPRGLLDCVVAAVAHRTGATVLSHDRDLARIAEVIGIPLDDASLRP